MSAIRTIRKKTVVVIVAAVVVLAGAGLAFAYWTSGGSGTGSAATGTSQDVVIHQTSTLDPMGPGVAAQTLSGNFDNPGPESTYVTSVTVSIASISGAGAGGCTASDYTITGAVMPVEEMVVVGTGVGSWGGATIAFASSATVNQDGCQGATVNLTYVSS